MKRKKSDHMYFRIIVSEVRCHKTNHLCSCLEVVLFIPVLIDISGTRNAFERYKNVWKLDELTARRHLKPPGHYPVDPYTWPWSPNGHGHEWPSPTPFVQCQSTLSFWDTAIHGQGHVCGQRSRSHLTLKFKGQGHCQTHWSHLRPGVQSTCLLLVLRPSDHFWLRYSKFHVWPWTFKVKVMAKVKHDGHI